MSKVLMNIFAFSLLVLLLYGNNPLQQHFKYAEQLFDQESYYEAITEFKRLQFFDEENLFAYQSNYKIGVAYKKGGFYENAIEYLTKAKIATENPDEKIESEFQIIRTNILRKTFIRSHQLLNELEKQVADSSIQNEINYWRGWTHMLADDWSSAAESFAEVSNQHDLKILCERVENDKYSVTFARVISYILPGAGQFYTGNYFAGFMSLAWNVLWGYLTVDAFIEDRAFDGVMVGSLLWLRFYRGGIQNAEQVAENENIEIANKAFLYLMENYRGEKP